MAGFVQPLCQGGRFPREGRHKASIDVAEAKEQAQLSDVCKGW